MKMNKTLIAGLSALVLAGCEEQKDNHKNIGLGSIIIPNDCVEIISVSGGYGFGVGLSLTCKTTEGTLVLYNKSSKYYPWHRYEIKRE